ncbi:hypothetical protein BGZ47_004356 [Haplosporangium gracile]|nr:hypothetical protein BGZ47_004356 [Haplosporangium gracile]
MDLLSQLPVECLERIIHILDEEDCLSELASLPTSLDYLAHIRHLNIQASDSWKLKHALLPIDLTRHLLEYIKSDEFDRLYQSNPFAPGYVSYFEDPFDGDDDIFGEIDGNYDDEFDRETESELDRKTNKQSRDEVIQDQLQFVKDHVQLFKSQLKSFDCLEGCVWQMVGSEMIDRIRVDFYRLLLPLSNPTYLGWFNGPHFLAHPLSTDLTHVQSIINHGLPES